MKITPVWQQSRVLRELTWIGATGDIATAVDQVDRQDTGFDRLEIRDDLREFARFQMDWLFQSLNIQVRSESEDFITEI